MGEPDRGEKDALGSAAAAASTVSMSSDVDLFQNLALRCCAADPNSPTVEGCPHNVILVKERGWGAGLVKGCNPLCWDKI